MLRKAFSFGGLSLLAGAAASAMVAEHLSPWIIQPDREHLWVNEKLGIAKSLSAPID